jgi:hypothetical protein
MQNEGIHLMQRKNKSYGSRNNAEKKLVAVACVEMVALFELRRIRIFFKSSCVEKTVAGV